MRLVAEQRTLNHVAEAGGTVYLWARATRCCAGRSFVLEAATTAPEHPVVEFQRLHEAPGITVWAPPGLVRPAELHLELGRRGRLRAFWNNQAWIG
jgi:hypothetical protein